MTVFNQEGQTVGLQINIAPTHVRKPTAIICDLDGTLAIHDGRKPYDYDKCDTDLVNAPVLMVLEAMMDSDLVDFVVFVSGREDSCREKTEQWLRERCGFYSPHLFMRKAKDYRKDYVVKEEIYREFIEPYYRVLFALDDRDQVVKLWRSLGLTCFQVAEGKF